MGLVRHSGSVGGSAGGLDDLYTRGTNISVSNTTTETDIFSYTVPGGTLGSDKWLELRIPVRVVGDGSGGPSIKVKYGATTILTTTAFTINGTTMYGEIVVWIRGDGATNAQLAKLDLLTLIHGGAVVNVHTNKGTAAEDSTTNLDLKVTWTWNATSAGLIVDAYGAVLRGPYAP